MPRRRVFSVLLSLVLVQGLFAGSLAAASLSVLSWNIARGIGSASANATTQAAIANVVNYLNPDVWTINELGSDTLNYSATTALASLDAFVASSLTIFGPNPARNSDYYVYLGRFSDGYIANAIVSRYPLLATQSFSDAGGGYSVLRGLAYALVDVPVTTNDVGVFTMHLKSGSLDADAARRQAEASANRATLAGWISQNPTRGAVVTGDFNASEDPGDSDNWSGGAVGGSITLGNGTVTTYQPVSTIRSAGLSDPAPVSISGDNDTINSTNPNARFDYTLYGGSGLTYVGGLVFDSSRYTATQLNAINSSLGLTITARTSALASDHLPVYAQFAVVPEPGVVTLLIVAGAAVLLTARRGRRIS